MSEPVPLDEETHYRILKLLQERSDITQRELARELGVSLGKAHYCLKALIDKGLIKAGNARRNPNKVNYTYLLTPSGVNEKARVTLAFVKRKQQEYDRLKEELKRLHFEAAQLAADE